MERLSLLHRFLFCGYNSLATCCVIPNSITRASRSPLNGKRTAGPNWFESTPTRATERGYVPNELNMSKPMTRPSRWRGMTRWTTVKKGSVL